MERIQDTSDSAISKMIQNLNEHDFEGQESPLMYSK